MTVRHLVLRGSNNEIGRKLAEIAIHRHGFNQTAAAATAPSVNLGWRKYFAEHYPILLERSRGVAEALGIDPEDERFDFTSIPYNQSTIHSPGCSSVYYPPSTTESSHGLLSRNFDFPKISFPETIGIDLTDEERKLFRPMMADPYLIEMHPENGGFSSISMVSFDLLSGVLDGMNSEGLVVAVHGNEIAMAEQQPIPDPEGIGLFELQSIRLLLDTCAIVEEAKLTLLANRHFYVMLPCIYLIADPNGNSLVFEPGYDGEEPHIIEGKNPQKITNHPLSRFPKVEDFPEKRSMLDAGTSSFERYDMLRSQLAGRDALYSVEDMKEINSSVSVSKLLSRIPEAKRNELVSQPGLARTLWHALYDLQELSLDIKFYTGEKKDEKGGFKEEYSDYFTFRLK